VPRGGSLQPGRQEPKAMALRLTKTYRTDDEAAAASNLLKDDWYLARIIEAVQKLSQKNRPMIELTVDVNGRLLRDWITASERAAAKVRSLCIACNCVDSYDRQELSQDLFPGHDVEVKIIIHKQRNFADQNRIELYRAAPASAVVNFRTAG
jgi:hypothetical protein